MFLLLVDQRRPGQDVDYRLILQRESLDVNTCKAINQAQKRIEEIEETVGRAYCPGALRSSNRSEGSASGDCGVRWACITTTPLAARYTSRSTRTLAIRATMHRLTRMMAIQDQILLIRNLLLFSPPGQETGGNTKEQRVTSVRFHPGEWGRSCSGRRRVLCPVRTRRWRSPPHLLPASC